MANSTTIKGRASHMGTPRTVWRETRYTQLEAEGEYWSGHCSLIHSPNGDTMRGFKIWTWSPKFPEHCFTKPQLNPDSMQYLKDMEWIQLVAETAWSIILHEYHSKGQSDSGYFFSSSTVSGWLRNQEFVGQIAWGTSEYFTECICNICCCCTFVVVEPLLIFFSSD